MDRYLVLLNGNESTWGAMTPEQMETAFADHGRFQRQLTERGHRLVSHGSARPRARRR